MRWGILAGGGAFWLWGLKQRRSTVFSTRTHRYQYPMERHRWPTFWELGRYCSRAIPDCLIRGRLGNWGSIEMRPRFSIFISAVLASLHSYSLHFPLVFLIASPTRAREKIKEAPGTAFSADRFTAKHLTMLGLFGVHLSTRRAEKREKQ